MSDQKSTVVIPCAGKGTRLYPLTKNLSKSLVKIGNYKMIDYAISDVLDNDYLDSIRKFEKRRNETGGIILRSGND